MTRSDLSRLKDRLTERDYQLLSSVETYRLLTTRQLQRLHFDTVHPTRLAAARACTRALTRLRSLGVLAALERRIGGVRAGSAGFAWYVGPVGERLLRDRHPESKAGRRNYREPSRLFVEHTLAVAELAVQTIEAARSGSFEVVQIVTEPGNWQQSLSPHGTIQWLKPDLRLVTATREEECHWYIEVDLATEHLPVIERQRLAYQTFRLTGRYQAVHGIFPIVLWVTPSEPRAAAIRAVIAHAATLGRLDSALFQVCTSGEYLQAIGGRGPVTGAAPDGGPQP